MTPYEEQKASAFSFDRMAANLGAARKRAQEDEERIFSQLPRMVSQYGRYPSISVERSRRYTDSIALVVREKKKWLFFSYTRLSAIDLSVHRLADVADELEFFVEKVIAGDAFERESTSGASHGELCIRCNYGVYQLTSSVYDYKARNSQAVSTITLGLCQMNDLVAVLRGFDVGSMGWRERNLA